MRISHFSFYFRPKIVWNYLLQLRSPSAIRQALRNLFILTRFLLGKRVYPVRYLLKKFRPLLTSATSLIILGLLLSRIKLNDITAALSLADPKVLISAALLSLLNNFLWITDKWRRTLKFLGYNIPYKNLLFARIGSYAIHGMLPLKTGEASRIAYLKKFHQVPLKAGTASVIITLALNILALAIFIMIGMSLRET